MNIRFNIADATSIVLTDQKFDRSRIKEAINKKDNAVVFTSGLVTVLLFSFFFLHGSQSTDELK